MDIRTLLDTASDEKIDVAGLQLRQAELVGSLRRQLLTSLDLMPRLERLVNEPIGLKTMDAEDIVDAFRDVIAKDDEHLQAELLALTVTVARLGSILMAMRLGRKMFEKMWADTEEAAHALS